VVELPPPEEFVHARSEDLGCETAQMRPRHAKVRRELVRARRRARAVAGVEIEVRSAFEPLPVCLPRAASFPLLRSHPSYEEERDMREPYPHFVTDPRVAHGSGSSTTRQSAPSRIR